MDTVISLAYKGGAKLDKLEPLAYDELSAGVTKRLALDLLVVNPDYQRGLKKSLVADIAKTLLPAALSVPTVNFRAGQYWIIDGQQRVAGCRLRGIKEIDCRVLSLATVEEEAALFRKLNNNRVNVTKLEQWKAALAAQEPTIVRLNNVIEANNMRVANGGGNRTVKCVGTIVNWARTDISIPMRAIHLMGRLEFNGCAPHLLMGGLCYLEWWLQKHGTCLGNKRNDNILTDYLVGLTFPVLETASMKYQTTANRGGGDGAESRAAKGLLELVNKGLRTNRIPTIMI